MTRVTCPKCHHTFEIEDRCSLNSQLLSTPVWTKYSNAQGLQCECDHCHGLFDEVYMYFDKEYYRMCSPSYLGRRAELPFRKFVCKDCISKELPPELIYKLEKDGLVLV